MAKRVLAIGVGGTGKTALIILKERLEETYGQVPDHVVMLAIDTDDLRDVDEFAGTSLSAFTDDRGREPEHVHVVSKPGVTMNTIFSDIASGRTGSYMQWLEKDKLDQILSPVERDIRGGAQQRRPIGRVALFQRWDKPIYSSIVTAIGRIYGEPDEELPPDEIAKEQNKRVIFIVGSVSGGTGSGFFIDVANLVRHAVSSHQMWQSIDVSALIVLPDAFNAYTTAMNDPTNLKPNAYAALREIDRFTRTHSASLPYMVRYGDDPRSITWGTTQPFDHVYLIDTACPSAMGDKDLSRGDPSIGVFPLAADFMMAHVDQSLADTLATLRSNAGLHYDKEIGWQYCSFNVYTYILPIDDIIESFSYRFLREIVTRQYLPVLDNKDRAQLEQKAQKETEMVFSQTAVGAKVNPGVIQKSIAATRRMDPERPDMSWEGLFNLIALADTSFAEDRQDLLGWLDYAWGNLLPSKEGEYKAESYDEGYGRLLNFSDQFMDECLGPQYDPDNEEARQGGEWDKILARYRDALRLRFSEVVDAALLDILNRRDSGKTLVAHQLPHARAMVATLKEKLIRFKDILSEEYRDLDIDTRLRQTGEDLRNGIVWMQDTKDTKTRAIFGHPDARKAQDSYNSLFYEKMQLLLHQRVFRAVIDVLSALGADDVDQDQNLSVLDTVALELENWEATFKEVDKLWDRWWREHEKNRKEKRQVKVRRYLTDPQFEEQLYQQPEHMSAVARQVLGEKLGVKGITWQRVDEEESLHYKIRTSNWAEESAGAEKVARSFFAGAKELFQVARESVTVADRIETIFKSPASFANVVGQINEPFLRYNPSANDKTMFQELYVSFNLSKASNEAREFLEDARELLRKDRTVDVSAESLVACTVVEIARGVHLQAVDQFVGCQADYRQKLFGGRESLHMFPEEQQATMYEGLIDMLGEHDNKQRPFTPDLVIAMGEESKLRFFTLACAYGLIEEGTHWNENEGMDTTEIFLDLSKDDTERRLWLSESQQVRNVDKSFNRVPAEEQVARLYLNALQNFVLKATAKPMVPPGMVDVLVQNLKGRGVDLGEIQNPFTLTMRNLNTAIKRKMDTFGPTEEQESDRSRREKINARRRVDLHLKPFLESKVSAFKNSPAQRVVDLGTVMHLILKDEINRLSERASGV